MDITFGSTVDQSCYDKNAIHRYVGRGWVVAVNGTDYNIVRCDEASVTLVASDFDTGDPIPGSRHIDMLWTDVQTLHIY